MLAKRGRRWYDARMHYAKKMSKSIRRHIARQKGVIRRQFSDAKKQAEAISELYKKYISK